MTSPLTEPAPYDKWIKELHTLVQELGITFVTATQISRPGAAPREPDWGPQVVVIDYIGDMKWPT